MITFTLTKQMKVGIPFVFKGETSIGDMVKVLKPFKVRDGDTSGVDIQIGDDKDGLRQEDFVSRRGGRAVRSFSDDLLREKKIAVKAHWARSCLTPILALSSDAGDSSVFWQGF